MRIQNVADDAFRRYGKVLEGYDFTELLKEMKHTPVPEDVTYVPSVEEMEALPVAKELQNKGYGGLPIEIGYCNGHNKKLNGLEYHRSSEINVAVTDLVLLIGHQQDVEKDFTYDTSKVEAFLVPAGTAIGYGATFVTDHETVVATIPIGYGDGYPRALSNKGSILIHGKKAPILGRICMDQTMVDISDIPEAKEGDEVVVIGKNGDNELSAEEVSELAGSFNYELLCDLGKRIPRVYYRHGKVVGSKDYNEDDYCDFM